MKFNLKNRPDNPAWNSIKEYQEWFESFEKELRQEINRIRNAIEMGRPKNMTFDYLEGYLSSLKEILGSEDPAGSPKGEPPEEGGE